jgi:type II secretory pathway component PulF
MKVVAGTLASKVLAGGKLSEAMAEFPKAFPPHIIGVVAAGELGGFLPIVSGDIALDYELAQRASSRRIGVINKLLWINALGTIIVAPFLPRFFSPGTVDFASGFRNYVTWTIPRFALPMAVLLIGYYIVIWRFSQPDKRTYVDSLLLRMPTLGMANRNKSLATFARILWRLQSAGILPIQAWDAASRSAENTCISSALGAQTGEIRNGKKFSEALTASGFFNSEDSRSLSIGETTGQTPDALQRMAGYYEDAAATAATRVKWFWLRISIFANLLALGFITIYGTAGMVTGEMNWVDWFFKQ